MKRIEGQLEDQVKRAKQVLSWIICAERPLTTIELQHALGVEIGEPELDEENIPQTEDMVTVCAGLVTVDQESSIIRLVHETTQSYFQRTKHRWFPNSQYDITATCTTYLSFQAFTNEIPLEKEEVQRRLKMHAFFGYAANNWGHHARIASFCPNILSFLQLEAQVEASCQVILMRPSNRNIFTYPAYARSYMTGLHLAAYFGLLNATKALMNSRDANSRDKSDNTPLSWAATNGHLAVVKELLGVGTVNAKPVPAWNSQQSLMRAVENGHEAVVELLLDPKTVGGHWENKFKSRLLSTAATEGHEAIVELLLADDGVDVNLEGHFGATPLWWAACLGNEAVVKLLLDDERVDVNWKLASSGQTALWRAADNGNEAIVNALLARGAESQSGDIYTKMTPLCAAAAKGHEATVMLLLNTNSMDLNRRDKFNRTALFSAAEEGHEAVVKILLKTDGVDANLEDDGGRTPLFAAAMRGHEVVVKLLLETEGVNPNPKDKNRLTALFWAAVNRHDAVVKLIREYQKAGC